MFRSSAISTPVPAARGRRRGRAAAILAAALRVCAGAPLLAEEAILVDVRLDRDRAAVGEPITMTVTARHQQPLSWEGRSVAGRAGSFDVDQVYGPAPPPPDPNAPEVAAPAPDANAAGPHVTRWIFRLAAFEIGKTQIPALTLRYTPEGGGEPASIETKALPVEIVATVTDPDEKPADIRSGFSLPRDWRGWIYLLGTLVAAGAAAFFAWRWWRKRREGPAAAGAAPPGPITPAYDRYLGALEALLRAGHLEAGRIKEFHVEISEIVKRYLGEVLGFDAIDRTTWEVMHDLQAAATPSAVRSETGAFLNECDLVKFARRLPARGEIDATVSRARRILDLARPSPSPSAVPGAPPPAGAQAASPSIAGGAG